jgi:hypothetical protein
VNTIDAVPRPLSLSLSLPDLPVLKRQANWAARAELVL